MKLPEDISSRILRFGSDKDFSSVLPGEDSTTVFTNGCFDILHAGHLHLLHEASRLGEFLVVGLNTDRSVRRLKGAGRPVKDELTRAALLVSFSMVDLVVMFDDDTPERLIESVRPDILVKGGDYRAEKVAGYDFMVSTGGKVVIVPYLEGYSSSGLIDKINSL